MSLFIAQKYFSSADAFEIVNEQNQCVWKVAGSLVSRPHMLEVYTASNQPVAQIERKSGLFGTKYNITISGALFETVKSSAVATKPVYELTRSAWKLEGDFLTKDFRIVTRHGGVVMTHEKKWFVWGNTCVLDFARREDELMGLCIALAINASSADPISGAKKATASAQKA